MSWWPRRRRQALALSVPGLSTDPLLVGRASYPSVPDRLWAADVAVGETEGGWLYLAAVLDCYSRRCVSWATSYWLQPQLVLDAVSSAALTGPPSGHSRRGGEVALALSPRCATAGIAVPDGATPSPLDAAVTESFFSMLAQDLLGPRHWPTRSAAAEAIAAWIGGAYNQGRFGSSLQAGA